MKLSLLFLSILLLPISLPAANSPAPQPVASPSPSVAPTDYTIQWGAKIPLRDKVELNATIYSPLLKAAEQTRLPVIFTLTPYISDSYHARAAYFAARGYVFALVDVRGRGNSGGDFEPFANEARDGHDVVEWLAQQPFCNGKVTMWGGSYAGYDQWATAKELPPHLATIVPVAAAHPGLDFPCSNNVGIRYDVQWLTFTSGHAGQANLFGDSKFWRSRFLEAYRQHLPFRMMDSFAGNLNLNFQKWIAHPQVDEYYDAMVPTTEQFAKIGIPILTITGQYDGDELGALSFYRDHLAHATAEARAKHFLVIGPWDHAGTRTPTHEVGGVKFGPGALLDLNDLHHQWYDWTMQGKAKPEFLKDQVAYYLLAAGNSGANGEWKYASDFQKLTSKSKPLYLDATELGGHGVFRSGKLNEKLPAAGADEFVYDPLDLHRGEIEGKLDLEKTSGLDQHLALNLGDDGLIYHSDAVDQAMALIGCPELALWLTTDVPDTDITAELAEIQPDGTSIALWSDVRRLRYRESPREGKMMKAGEAVRCDFAPGLFIARRLMKGSRLRLIVTSPNSIYLEKNYNSGGAVADETAKDARTAHLKILHDANHASVLEVPLVGAP